MLYVVTMKRSRGQVGSSNFWFDHLQFMKSIAFSPLPLYTRNTVIVGLVSLTLQELHHDGREARSQYLADHCLTLTQVPLRWRCVVTEPQHVSYLLFSLNSTFGLGHDTRKNVNG
jgi:hypothetical protein